MKCRFRSVLSLLALAPALARPNSVPAGSQSAKPALAALETVELDRFEVTDRRVQPFSTASVDLPRTVNDVQPYVVFDSATIARSGALDVQDFLRRSLTMDATRMAGSQGIALTGVGSSFDLRGFGANHTLVLINGRRSSGGNLSAVNANNDQPNLNGIPLGAIERIEVLPTSGAAIYGASAVGGVINVILKRNYTGGEIRTSYQNTFDSDAPIRRVEVNYGLSLEGGKTHVNLSGGYSDIPALAYQDRPFLHEYELHRQQLEGGPAGVFTFTTAAPNIRTSPTSQNLTLKPAFGGGALNSSATFVPVGTGPAVSPAVLGAALLANAGQQNLKLPATIQYRGGLLAEMGTASTSKSLLASIRREMTPRLELNTDFSYMRNDGERHLSSLQLITVPAAAPVNPFNQAVSVYLASPVDRATTTESETRQATLGFVLKLPARWIAQGDYTWSEQRNAFASPSNLSANDLNVDLLAGRINPFVDADLHPVDLAPYLGDLTWAGKGTLHDVALRATGPVGRLPAGEPTLVVGLERREESTDDGLRSQTFPGFPARDTHTLFLGKSQITHSAYAELNVPLVASEKRVPLIHQLDAQIATRFEDYEVDTGTGSIALVPAPATPPTILTNQARYRSTQPTAGLRYRPLKGVMLRASYSGGFIPPTYAQLLRNPIPSPTLITINDPRRGNTARSVQTLSGGNPDLQPETARSWNAGVVLAPEFAPGLRVSVDYYRIKKENNIGSLSAQVLVENESLFPDRIVRDAAAPGDPYGVGPITLVDTASMNLLRAFNEGFDVTVNYRQPTAGLGTFHLNAVNTFARHYQRQTVFGAPYLDWVNFSGNGPLKYRSTGSLTWERRRWTLGWSTHYYGRYNVLGPPVFSNLVTVTRQGGRFVSSQIYHNAFVAYRFVGYDAAPSPGRNGFTRGLELQVGIENVFDRVPPYEGASPNGFTYSTWGSLRLREYRLSLRKAF